MNDNVRRAMIEAIEKTPMDYYKFDQIKNCKFEVVEKFIRHHKLDITISDVLGYRDMALLGSGKKGHIIAKTFLYYSENGKPGTKIVFDGMTCVNNNNTQIFVEYQDGKKTEFSTSTSTYAEYYAALLNVFIKTNAVETEPAYVVEVKKAIELMRNDRLDEAIEILEKHARDGRMIAVYHLAEAMTKKGKYKVALQYANLVVDSPADNEYKQGASALIEKIHAALEAEKRAEEEKKQAELEKRRPKSDDEELQKLMDKLDGAFEEKFAELEQIEQEAEDEKAMKIIDEAIGLMEEEKWDDVIQMLLDPLEKGYVLAGYYAAVAFSEKGEYEQALRWAEIVVNSEIEEEAKQEVNELIQKIEDRIEEEKKVEQEKLERQNEIERLKKITKEGVETFKAGKAEKALQCWKEAADLGFILSMFYLAQACSRRGEVNEAVA